MEFSKKGIYRKEIKNLLKVEKYPRMKQGSMVALLIAIGVVCSAQIDTNMMENGRRYDIFMNVHITFKRGESDKLYVNSELITSLPVEIKAIIARYSLHLAHFVMSDKTEKILAKAFGDFPTLEAAQDSLAKVWDGKGLNVANNFLTFLSVCKLENSLFFEYSLGNNRIVDKFEIDKNKNIRYVGQTDK